MTSSLSKDVGKVSGTFHLVAHESINCGDTEYMKTGSRKHTLCELSTVPTKENMYWGHLGRGGWLRPSGVSRGCHHWIGSGLERMARLRLLFLWKGVSCHVQMFLSFLFR